LAGLIESGNTKTAEALIKRFRPVDARLLLGIHLGCFLVQHVRVVDDAERRAAERICALLAGKVDDLRRQVFVEYKSELIELRKGQIRALPAPVSDASLSTTSAPAV
jgi:hypothetical protein